jgi:23S rRNA pseudouridine1911/1915/1917 synthase
MKRSPLEILYEDNHLLAVAKPAGLPTMGVEASEPSLWRLGREYLKEKYQKPGNVYLGIVSRLDSPVTGIVLMARTSKAARRLTEQFRERQVGKRYWALVERSPDPPQGRWVDWLRKEERLHKVLVCHPDAEGAQRADLSYRTLTPGRRATLLEIELETGRKHQIRVQLAARRLPVLGDRKYGSPVPFPAGIGLHARELRFEHPVRRIPITLVAPVPDSWHAWGIR